MNPFLGVILHAIGGLAAASFYIPYKKVKKWSWESYWLAGGFFSWIIAPWVLAWAFVPRLGEVLSQAPAGAIFWSYFFGLLWGIGGLTFGLSMRYLGISLGYALALGFCAAFGTLIPPIFHGKFAGLAASGGGQVVLLGVSVCLVGIAVCGRAGMLKEDELSHADKQAEIAEFNFWKGVWVATFAGVMSACMAFAIDAGKPIAERAVQLGTLDIRKNFPVFLFIMAGGFTTNFVWCMILAVRNRSAGDYVNGAGSPLLANYLLCALAGVTWYLQFTFYGMGTTQMGKYDFSSWTLHMAFIIIFSNVWGIALHEWRGSSRRTFAWITAGIALLFLSTVIVGYGNKLSG